MAICSWSEPPNVRKTDLLAGTNAAPSGRTKADSFSSSWDSTSSVTGSVRTASAEDNRTNDPAVRLTEATAAYVAFATPFHAEYKFDPKIGAEPKCSTDATEGRTCVFPCDGQTRIATQPVAKTPVDCSRVARIGSVPSSDQQMLSRIDAE